MKPLRRRAEHLYRMKNFAATLPYHLLVMSGVAVISFIFDKWVEAVCFLVAFFALRYKFQTTFHAQSMVACMTLTNLIFATSIMICPNSCTYVFGAMVFAYIDCLALWHIQRGIEDRRTIEQLKTRKRSSENVAGRRNCLRVTRKSRLGISTTTVRQKKYGYGYAKARTTKA